MKKKRKIGNIQHNSGTDKKIGTDDKKVVLPDGITEIGNGRFSGQADLKEIKIPESVEIIGKNAFKNCKNLTAIEIPASVRRIETGAFRGCTGLKTVEIKGHVSLYDFIFGDCRTLEKVIFHHSPKYDGYSSMGFGEGTVFAGCKNVTLTIMGEGNTAELKKKLLCYTGEDSSSKLEQSLYKSRDEAMALANLNVGPWGHQ